MRTQPRADHAQVRWRKLPRADDTIMILQTGKLYNNKRAF